MDAKAIANETLAALAAGGYTAPDGTTVAIGDLLATCVSGTRCYTPDELAAIATEVASLPVNAAGETTFAVANVTTLQECAALAAGGDYPRIGVLNFASARKPGGGVLNGARAQEESLARSSGLYESLRQCPQFYEFHRAQTTSLYSDRMIYSPGCPVLRNDEGDWLARPYTVDFITSPAPNAGAIMRNEPTNRARITPTLIERIGRILALAAHWQCDTLVLGAWGCGVFQNDPTTVSAIFASYLRRGGAFAGRFRHISFAVYDTSPTRGAYDAFVANCGNLPEG